MIMKDKISEKEQRRLNHITDPVEIENEALLRKSMLGPGHGMRSHLKGITDAPFIEMNQVWDPTHYEKVFGHG
jgi:hypothetical protein